jgi:hypothetical protein
MKTRADEPNGADEAVARILDRIEMEDPPGDLKQNVLRAIGTRPEPARRSGWFESLRAGIRQRLFIQVYPFAAGAAAGVLVFALASGSGFWRDAGNGPSDGAMAPAFWGAGNVAGGSSGSKVDDQRFELGRANVQFEVFRASGADRAVVSVRTLAADPVVITIQLPRGAGRVERLLTIPSSPGGVEYGRDGVRIRQSGRDRAEIGLALEPGADDTPIRIAVTSQEGTVQGALHIASAPGATARQAP